MSLLYILGGLITNLVNELTAMNVIGLENLCPEFKLTALNKVPSLLLEHRVVIGDADELLVAESLGVRDVRKVRVARFAEFTNNERLVELTHKRQRRL